MSVDSKLFRSTMGHFPTGVTVVTTHHPQHGYFGVTISSLASVSLTPPLVLFCMGTSGHSINIFREVDHFTFNILSHDQDSLSNLFASRMPIDWNNINFSECPKTKAPILEGALGHISCQKFQTYPGGDHEIFVGEVLDMGINQTRQPLIRYAGEYHSI